MVGSSKILTVSYGTFSCTLEGFDDSFGSMKAIAEYFRDLAQEDRYFGAEPPTPDAEMLAKIAEREISRRVEAQMDEGGIHLRASAPSAAVAALSAAAEAAPEEAGAEPEPAGEPEIADDEAATAEVVMPPVVDEPEVAPLDATAFMAAPTEDTTTAPAAPAGLTGDASGIAAKLKRIRAVVGDPDAAAADVEDFESPSATFPNVADDAEEDEAPQAEAIADETVFEDEADVLAFEEDVAPAAEVANDDETSTDVDAMDEDATEVVVEQTEETASADDSDEEADTAEADIAIDDTVNDADVAETEETSASNEVAEEEEVSEDAAAEAEPEELTADADEIDAVGEEEAEVATDETVDEAVDTTDEDVVAADEDVVTADADVDTPDTDVVAADEDVVAADELADAAADEAVAEDQVEDQSDTDDEIASDLDDTAEEEDLPVQQADEDVAWATAALASSLGDASNEDILSNDTADADDEAEIAQTDVDTEADADADEDASELSSDLNDIDPIVPTIAAAASPARIVRIRKSGPAEIVTLNGDDDSSDESSVSVALKTEAGASDLAEDAAPEVAEDTPAEVAEDITTEAPLSLDAEMLVDDQDDVNVEETVDAPAEDALVPSVPAADAAHDDIRAAIAAAMPAGSLSDEDEDDLQRELAAVAEEVVVLEDEAPVADEEVVVSDTVETIEDVASDDAVIEATEEDNIFDEVAEAVEETVAEETPPVSSEEIETSDAPDVVESRPRSRRRLPDADYAVTRMIAQTDEALNEPAGSRRRNAIAQLKAAVAATEAARQLGDDENAKGEAENAFRNDLNEVVRPSKPIEVDTQAERPRAAPLKLVASQRVDGEETEEPVAEAPSAQPQPAASDNEYGGFAQFAASMGATELPDLLEAAAAYTSFVEGVEDFSRPQIMKKVQMTTTEEFSREDGLRSFGTLLRQGRISKVRNGRFQVSEQTRFRPDARSA
ncbi:MAG: hypothetical protein AAFQ64_03475 [Pseudomonadota bacterium]